MPVEDAALVRSGGSSDRSHNGACAARPLAWFLWTALKTLVKLAAGIWEGRYPVWKSAKPGVQRPARVGGIETANTFIHP